MTDWHDFDDWKQITTNLVIAEGQVLSFDTLLEKLRLRTGTAGWLVGGTLCMLLLCIGIMLLHGLRQLQHPLFEFLPAITVLLVFALITGFMHLQKMRELMAEAEQARAVQEHARRRVLARDLRGSRP